MQRAKCYLIRHQKRGILVDKIYLKPPSAEEFKKAVSGFETGWAKVIEAVVEGPESLAGFFQLLDPMTVEQTEVVQQQDQEISIGTAATGVVTAPQKR